ncbi:adenylate/guanylate cyclase domain-containing protein [Aegicerativicinus sediminis]|uniref:adenylate/guanylate cyclase domain-containing protein n=1 Tax=Aegicerativicinus sediminis TaxID=2893202 RepID=UPI001E410A97|nr:adenylate/guanylate cyclase domain-containing protein [Aegicerativicinus sediminis]
MRDVLHKLLILLLFLGGINLMAQNQNTADSLSQIYHANPQTENSLELLNVIAVNHTNPENGLEYSNLLIEKATEKGSSYYIMQGYLRKGYWLERKGNLPQALEAYFTANEEADKLEDVNQKNTSKGAIDIAIASTYKDIGNPKYADLYYNKGIEILQNSDDKNTLATSYYNYGDYKVKRGDYSEAYELLNKAQNLFQELQIDTPLPYIQGNFGIIYAAEGKDSLGLSTINQAVTSLEKNKDFYAASAFLLEMANIYSKQENYDMAFIFAERSLALAEQYGLIKEMSDANLKLSELYEGIGENGKALPYFKNYVTNRDSITNLKAMNEIANMRTDFEVSQKQIEVAEQRRTKNIVIMASVIVVALMLALAIGLFRRNKFIRSTSAIIEREKSRSDNLLLNILPAETAKELKDKGRVAAKRFDNVSVLFTDFKGFTLHSEHLSPEDLVKTVDFYFSKFDAIIDKYELEKIKTIGDAYMCASGLPFEREDHAERIVKAAMEIVEFVEFAKTNNPDNHPRFEVRVGIHSGQVVAGVVGRKKFAYDIWGDTVNTAARMETYSEDGRINISEDTHALVKDKFHCNYRGKIEVKNKGSLKMYFVNGYITEPEPSLVNHQSDTT